MAKKFMYVCLGILALVLAFHLGARYGEAGYVDRFADGMVARGGGYAMTTGYFLLSNGEGRCECSEEHQCNGCRADPCPVRPFVHDLTSSKPLNLY